jgi:hypothetical protein
MYELKRFDFTPILGWSVSRFDLFNLCKRQYYYNYYAKYDKEFPRSKIDKLKKMTSIPLEIGNLVHDVIKTLLERLQTSDSEINHEKFYDYAKRKTEQYCNQKEFSEIYYNEIDQLNIDEIFTKVEICLKNILNSKRFNWLFTEALKFKSNWIIEPPGYGETRINELKAYCKVDFLFPFDDSMYIMDWKTGKADDEKHNKQLIGYSTWASFHFGQEPEKIVPILAYLNPEYKETEIRVNEFDIQEFSSKVKDETEEMYSFCVDVEENIPKEKDNFSKTPFSKICDYCNYRELCF